MKDFSLFGANFIGNLIEYLLIVYYLLLIIRKSKAKEKIFKGLEGQEEIDKRDHSHPLHILVVIVNRKLKNIGTKSFGSMKTRLVPVLLCSGDCLGKVLEG